MTKKQMYADMQRQKDIKEDKMKTLIKAAMERFEVNELLEMLNDCSSSNQREDLKDTMIALTTEADGSFYIKVDSMVKAEKLNDFITTEIYPYYNEQQNCLFL